MVGEGVGFCFWLFDLLRGNLLVEHISSMGLFPHLNNSRFRSLSISSSANKKGSLVHILRENKGYRGRRKAKSAYSADVSTEGVELTVVLLDVR